MVWLSGCKGTIWKWIFYLLPNTLLIIVVLKYGLFKDFSLNVCYFNKWLYICTRNSAG